MEFFFHELDKSVLILSADGGLNAETAAEFIRQLESLIDGGVTQIIVGLLAAGVHLQLRGGGPRPTAHKAQKARRRRENRVGQEHGASRC